VFFFFFFEKKSTWASWTEREYFSLQLVIQHDIVASTTTFGFGYGCYVPSCVVFTVSVSLVPTLNGCPHHMVQEEVILLPHLQSKRVKCSESHNPNQFT